MATTKQEFVDVAAELFEEFADFATPRTFSKPGGGYDPVTGTSNPAITDTVPAIREDYKARDVDGTIIQGKDFMLLARVNQFTTLTPRTDGVTVNVDGTACQIINAEKDAADAVWVMQVRSL